MTQILHRRSNWLVGCIVGISLLSGCSGQEEQSALTQDSLQVASEKLSGNAQDLRNVTVSVSAAKSAFGAGEDVEVTVTLRNDGRHAVKLLKWYTPAEGVEEPLFKMRHDAKEVAFNGPHYKRPAAQEKDFIRLASGESLTRTVSLSDYDLSQSGNYTVTYDFGLKSNSIELFIEGRAAKATDGGVDAQLTSSITFSGRCSTTQMSTLMDAMNAASAMADNSTNYLSTVTPSGTPRYATWFGAFSLGGWSTAKTHFVAIKDAFDTKPITLDCSCKKSYYAYVYPNQPYKIYVCNAFWNAPLTGTDSKGGTLIHEMSHFTAVAGTDDHVYGQAGAKNLALTDPTAALNNADSHEYFAENTPFLQ